MQYFAPYFSKFSGGACPRTPLDSSCLRRSRLRRFSSIKKNFRQLGDRPLTGLVKFKTIFVQSFFFLGYGKWIQKNPNICSSTFNSTANRTLKELSLDIYLIGGVIILTLVLSVHTNGPGYQWWEYKMSCREWMWQYKFILGHLQIFIVDQDKQKETTLYALRVM